MAPASPLTHSFLHDWGRRDSVDTTPGVQDRDGLLGADAEWDPGRPVGTGASCGEESRVAPEEKYSIYEMGVRT